MGPKRVSRSQQPRGASAARGGLSAVGGAVVVAAVVGAIWVFGGGLDSSSPPPQTNPPSGGPEGSRGNGQSGGSSDDGGVSGVARRLPSESLGSDPWIEYLSCHSPSYAAFDASPDRCGRMAVDGLLTPDEADALLGLGEAGFALGKQTGPAGIMDLHQGAVSYDDQFLSIYQVLKGGGAPKSWPGLKRESLQIYAAHIRKLGKLVADTFGVGDRPLYLASPGFFSRMYGDRPVRSVHDEYWHPHVDTDQYEAFVFTTLTYFTNCGPDFEGGEFVFINMTAKGPPEGTGSNAGEGKTGTAGVVVPP
eukprot:Hpha_TRINITY_DN15724_c3_g1::TRINITY_DN15724_c3_g1_i3::g.40325::m.40325